MTDLTISDGAVKWWLQDSCCGSGHCQTSDENCEALEVSPADIGDVHYGIELILTYYAAHPEELPQEVVDAVRGMDGTVKATDPVRKVGTAEVVNALAESSLLNNTDWD